MFHVGFEKERNKIVVNGWVARGYGTHIGRHTNEVIMNDPLTDRSKLQQNFGPQKFVFSSHEMKAFRHLRLQHGIGEAGGITMYRRSTTAFLRFNSIPPEYFLRIVNIFGQLLWMTLSAAPPTVRLVLGLTVDPQRSPKRSLGNTSRHYQHRMQIPAERLALIPHMSKGVDESAHGASCAPLDLKITVPHKILEHREANLDATIGCVFCAQVQSLGKIDCTCGKPLRKTTLDINIFQCTSDTSE